jgi:hypothetical protein
MSYQEKDQSGTLFKNDRKERDSQPDWTGKAIVNGVPVYVSGWNKDGRVSLAFKNRQEGSFEKKPQQGANVAESRNPAGGRELTDDIPF